MRDVLDGLLGGVDAAAYTEGLATPVAQMSGGEKRRAGLARLLVEDPDLLILDEPTNHLDVAAIEQLEVALQAFEGTLLFVSHDKQLAEALAPTATWRFPLR